MMNFETLSCKTTGFVTTLWLARPDRRNAINLTMATELAAFFEKADQDPQTRVVVIRGKGGHFCSGGDLNWMLQSPELPAHQQTGNVLAGLFRKVYEFSKPVITVVTGKAMGGALGLIAASDFVVAHNDASFCFSEVKLGLAPATISPFVVKRLGEFKSRQLMTTAMSFNATDAVQYCLAEMAGTPTEVEAFVDKISRLIVDNAPEAVKTTKQIIRKVANAEMDDPLSAYSANMLLRLQGSEEAKEGINAFLEKRMAVWPVKKIPGSN